MPADPFVFILEQFVNLNQLRFVREAVRQDLNLSAVAKALYTSQPGISRAILELEEELGVQIFTRHSKRLRAITDKGKLVVAAAERVLREVEVLKRIAVDHDPDDHGELTVAATHAYARAHLPVAVARFRTRFPKVVISMRQGSATQVSDMVRNGSVDLALMTGHLPSDDALLTLPWPACKPVSVLPLHHPLAGQRRITLDELAQFSLIVEDDMISQCEIFREGDLAPHVTLRAGDAEIAKTCVQMGLGIGIVADLAFDEERDCRLTALPVEHLHGFGAACVVIRRDAFRRSYLYTLAELLSPAFSREVLERLDRGWDRRPKREVNNVTPLRRPERHTPDNQRQSAHSKTTNLP
jgi:LysR family transcriptional regulator, cys regulon transcriptional activator